MQVQERGSRPRTRTIIIITAVVVVAMVILGVVYYIVNLGFGSSPGPGATPLATCNKAPVAGGWQFTIVSITYNNVPWGDVQVLLTDGPDFAQWHAQTADLDGGHNVTATYPADLLSALSVNLTVTDTSGNGKVSKTDFFTLTTAGGFPTTATFITYLIYEPTGERMGAAVAFP